VGRGDVIRALTITIESESKVERAPDRGEVERKKESGK
jgi:hypothetical protein